MSVSRREILQLLAGAGAVLSATRSACAAIGDAAAERSEAQFYSAFASSDRATFGIGTLGEDVDRSWSHQVESRLHGGSVRPGAAELAVVARRPGGFFLVLDARDGTLRHTVKAQAGRYYLGHAVFSADGAMLFTTEAIAESGVGLVGVYDVGKSYARLAEWPTGATDPHELVLSQDGASLWIANGGIETLPGSGRARLNENGIDSSLVRIDFLGRTLQQFRLDKELGSLSIRHIALTARGDLVFGCQDQGDVAAGLPLFGIATQDGGCRMLGSDTAPWLGLNGYVGAVATDRSGTMVVGASPRGNRAWFQVIDQPERMWTLDAPDVCGVAALGEPNRFLLTTGFGIVLDVSIDGTGPVVLSQSSTDVRWDNHVIRERQDMCPGPLHGRAL